MSRLAITFLWATSMLNAAPFGFVLLPGSVVSGTAGSTIGWGYSITNPSLDQWLVLNSVNSGTFVGAVPEDIFDFPILAPLTTLNTPFDLLLNTGLLKLTVAEFLAVPVASTGSFVLNADWYDGDPFNGGRLIGAADSAIADYQAELSPSEVPEPATATLLILAGTLLLAKRKLVRRV